MEATPRIASVRPVGGMRLLVCFRNGESRIYDCEPLLSHPRFRLLATPAFFRAVKVDAGGYGISWNDDMDLSEHELWTNGKPVADNACQADAPARVYEGGGQGSVSA